MICSYGHAQTAAFPLMTNTEVEGACMASPEARLLQKGSEQAASCVM